MARAVHDEALIQALREERATGHAEGEASNQMTATLSRKPAADTPAPVAAKVGFVHRHPAARAPLPRSPQLPAAPAPESTVAQFERPARVVSPARLAPVPTALRGEPQLHRELPLAPQSKAASGNVQRIQPALQSRLRAPTAAAAVRTMAAPVAKPVRGEVVRSKVQPAREVRKVRMPQRPQKGFFANLSETIFGLLVGANFGLHLAMAAVFVYYWTRGFR